MTTKRRARYDSLVQFVIVQFTANCESKYLRLEKVPELEKRDALTLQNWHKSAQYRFNAVIRIPRFNLIGALI